MQTFMVLAILYTDMEHGDGAASMYAETAARLGPGRPTSCSARPTMSKANTPAQAGTTIDAQDELQSLPFDRYELGVDGEGSVHFHSPRADRVVVVDEAGDIEETFDLAGKKLAGFIAHVDEHRGWETLRYKETFGEVLAEALAPTGGER